MSESSRPGFTPDRLQRLIDIDGEHFWFRGRRRLIDRLLEPFLRSGGRDVLELGPGSGAQSISLSRAGLQVIAVDFLPGGLRRLRAAAPEVRALQSSGEHLPLQMKCCDAVLALDVLEHLDDGRAVAELLRVLRPGGWLIVTVPAFGWMWSYRDVAAGHKRRYSRRMLLDLLHRAGFATEQTGYYQFFLFPLAVLTRWFGRRSPSTREWEDRPHPVVNSLLGLVNRMEVALGKLVPWPFGSSLFALARRPGGLGEV